MSKPHLHDCPTVDLEASIAKIQNRQKRVHPSSAEWLDMDECLAPMFEEMARRQREGVL